MGTIMRDINRLLDYQYQQHEDYITSKLEDIDTEIDGYILRIIQGETEPSYREEIEQLLKQRNELKDELFN